MIIYVIHNLVNGKKYVGQTKNSLEKRWKGHCLKSSNKMIVDRSIKKYGEESFVIGIVEECESLDHMNIREKFWAYDLNTFHPNGYNLKAGSGIGAMSEFTKRKISKSNKGKVRTSEWLKNLSISHMGWVPSEETREKWRKCFSGKKPSENTTKASILALQKTYTLIDPFGNKVTFTNMKKFCRENNLSNSKLCLVASGKRRSHLGWTRDLSSGF